MNASAATAHDVAEARAIFDAQKMTVQVCSSATSLEIQRQYISLMIYPAANLLGSIVRLGGGPPYSVRLRFCRSVVRS